MSGKGASHAGVGRGGVAPLALRICACASKPVPPLSPSPPPTSLPYLPSHLPTQIALSYLGVKDRASLVQAERLAAKAWLLTPRTPHLPPTHTDCAVLPAGQGPPVAASSRALSS
eukprot:52049-Chlamydomonas_euryale.AAC.1